MLDRDSILNLQDRPVVPVPVPEWGGTVHIRVLSVAEMELLQNAKHGAADLVARTCCDAQGNRLFTDEDAKALREKSQVAITRIMTAFNKANGLGDDEIEAAEKNS